jgi:hypothetical protein
MSERASQARQRRIAEPPKECGAFRGPQENAEGPGAPAKSRSDFVGWFCGVHKRSREEAM